MAEVAANGSDAPIKGASLRTVVAASAAGTAMGSKVHVFYYAFSDTYISSVRTALDAAVTESPRRVVVDMSEVTYIDSTAIHTLLSAYRRLTGQGGELCLVVEHPSIRRVLSILRIDKLAGLVICTDVVSAQSTTCRQVA